ncbi:MAG TPA: ABC transporter ATP-binding protein [Clostridiales bacterium]|nr:ABC transporter ATP-binding protein [Clostridiales bacterium]
MNLKYELPKKLLEFMKLEADEEIRYCAPYDLSTDGNYIKDSYVAVTNKRIVVFFKSQIIHNISLFDCQDILCEKLVDNGVLSVIIGGQPYLLARFSMRHVARFAYIARGAKLLASGQNKMVVSLEQERICEKCGRAIPGTRECPHCDGRRATLKKFWQLCSPYKFNLLFISVLMVATSAFNLVIPYVLKEFIDRVLYPRAGGFYEVLIFISVILSLTILLITFNIAKNWWCASLGAKISMDLRAKLYHKIQQLSLSFINSRKPGDLMNRVVGDTSNIRRFIEQAMGSMLTILITMIGALALMLRSNAILTLISVVFLPVVIVLSRMWRKHIRRLFRNQRFHSDRVNSLLQDVISGMRVVKLYGREEDEIEKFDHLNERFASIQKRNEVFWAKFYPILTFIMGLGLYFVTYFGGLDVLKGNMTPGGLTQFVSYAGMLYGPLGWMTHLPRMIMQLVTGLERIYDVLDEEPEIADLPDAIDHEIKGDITFKNVSFGYKAYEPVLENINLEVKKGEMIGLVGPSGAGKSTMINLIMRLYDVDEGQLLIDGIDIRNIKTSSLHSQIGVVLQETFLFSGTILNNLRFAKPDATLEEIIMAAKMANAHDFICKLPDGYNTYIGEKGNRLSGGERQRLAIARAILVNPRLLILDEATSSLDTESEYLIQEALKRLTKGRTTFAIAHRLSTLRNANRLIVIDNHTIIESGTHDELMRQKGLYYKLVNAQLQMAALQEANAGHTHGRRGGPGGPPPPPR